MSDLVTFTSKDPNTLSNWEDWSCHHIDVDFDIDFESQKFYGNVVLDLRPKTSNIDKIILDTNYVDVKTVKVNGETVKWKLGDRVEHAGSPLIIDVPFTVEGKVSVEISVSTTDKCLAIQWLSPEQTSNKKHPFMFSQCEAIHARDIFPCLDTPSIKQTVSFTLRSPHPVVASGLPHGISDVPGKSGVKEYKFKQNVPIPIYLFAVASGDIVKAPIGPRSHIWASPDIIDAAKWEFEADMEKMILAAEKLISPYSWGQYDILMLPPSFPFGAMENPNMTFITSSVLSGDRQNVDIVAHELSHSWSGNLVTTSSWEHFWLNESWTMMIQRKIEGALHGESYRHFSAIIGWEGLARTIEDFGADHPYTKLVLDLKGVEPDDAYSLVAYEKGFILLWHLEQLVGQSKFDKFIHHYFRLYKGKALDSLEFKKCFVNFFASDGEATKQLNEVDWDTWFYKPGMPPKPKFDTSLADVCYELAKKWEILGEGASNDWSPKASDLDGWLSNQSVVLLDTLLASEKTLSPAVFEKLGSTYSYSSSPNIEVKVRYHNLGLKSKAESIVQPTVDLLGTIGRGKYVLPLYKRLKSYDEALADKTFQRYRSWYHPISRVAIEKVLYSTDKISTTI